MEILQIKEQEKIKIKKKNTSAYFVIKLSDYQNQLSALTLIKQHWASQLTPCMHACTCRHTQCNVNTMLISIPFVYESENNILKPF